MSKQGLVMKHVLVEVALVVLCLLQLQSMAVASDLTAAPLIVLTEDGGPGNRVENGRPTGYNVEVVREILRRVKHLDNIEIVPWARGFMLLKEKPNVALFSTARTTERESMFKWVGPTSINSWVLYKKTSNPLQINNLEEARKVGSIGVRRDDVRHAYLLEKGFTNVSPVNLEIQNPQKLLLGRIDLWMTSNLNFIAKSNEAGISMSEFTKVLDLQQSYLYVALSKETPDETVTKWQSALDAMKKDGTYKDLMASHPAGALAMTFAPPKPALPEPKKSN